MSPSTVIMVFLFYTCTLCTTTNTCLTNYFNRKIWFDDGNIFHIDHDQFWTTFQQHRNVNRHIHWLANEISSLNHQIKSIKDQLSFVVLTREQRVTFHQQNTDQLNNIPLSTNETSKANSSSISIIKNQRNIYIFKLLSREPLFHGYIHDLIDIYQISLTITIECIAVVLHPNSNEKYLFIQLSNGNIDTYQMNQTKSLKESFWKLNQPLSMWNDASKQLEYYRRFIQDSKTNEIMITDQLMEIKNRPRLNDVHFFDMMGQMLRIKYHTDPSSLSCILEVFFGNIYTCDGRLVHPHELKLLSDNNNLFVFYAVMMETPTEKQIYPLGTNNHIRQGEQIFFLYHNHPQYNALSSLTCKDCVRYEQLYVTNNEQEKIEQNTDKVIEAKPVVDIEQNPLITNSQNYIVYILVTSILIYTLFSIYRSQKQESTGCLARSHSVSTRRGR